MIAFVVRVGCGFLLLVLVAGALSCSLLAHLYVPEGEPVLGGIAPDARLVVTAEVAPVYADRTTWRALLDRSRSVQRCGPRAQTRQNRCGCPE